MNCKLFNTHPKLERIETNPKIGAGASTRFSVCVLRNDKISYVEAPSGTQTPNGRNLRQPRPGVFWYNYPHPNSKSHLRIRGGSVVSEFFKWLTGNPFVTGSLVVFLGVVVALYVVAFLQGRSISFWPPKIGAKPDKPKTDQPGISPDQNPQPSGQNPIVGRGTVLATASGDKVTIESNFYGGASATLFRGRNSSGQQVIAKLFWRDWRRIHHLGNCSNRSSARLKFSPIGI